MILTNLYHDDVIKWKHFPRYWPFVRGIHRSPVNSSHKDQWRGALMLSLICALTNGWVNSRDADDLRRNRAHYDVIVMIDFKECHRHSKFRAIQNGQHLAEDIFKYSCCILIQITLKFVPKYHTDNKLVLVKVIASLIYCVLQWLHF